jgi:hypothetical protein
VPLTVPSSSKLRLASETLKCLAFGHGDYTVYAVIDGAAMPGHGPDLQQIILDSSAPHARLLKGDHPPEVEAVAPRLVMLQPDSAVTSWFFGQGWGLGLGVLALAAADLRTMRRHFQALMQVSLPDGRIVSFRWYDPAILRVYLPSCTATEAGFVFGPVALYLTEGDDPHELRQFIRFDHGVAQTAIMLPE